VTNSEFIQIAAIVAPLLSQWISTWIQARKVRRLTGRQRRVTSRRVLARTRA
jgi:hypothetical protein